MATATVTTINNDELVFVPEKITVIPGKWERKERPATKTYTLNLSEDEARTLVGVTRKISGDYSGSRGHTDSIQKALVGVGLPNKSLSDCEGALRFPASGFEWPTIVW